MAKIGETEYTSLEDAVAAAGTNGVGTTIVLQSDVTLEANLKITKELTIDGSKKHTISVSDSFGDSTAITLTNSGNVTLKDVTIDGKQKTRCLLVEGGKLVVDGATVTHGKSGSIGGVYMTNKSTFEMTSGNITGNTSTSTGYWQYASDLWIGSEVVGTTINGGTIGNIFVNGNDYTEDESGERRGIFTMNGGKADLLYLEYDTKEKFGGRFKYEAGTIDDFYLAPKKGAAHYITVKPEAGVLYEGGTIPLYMVKDLDDTYSIADGGELKLTVETNILAVTGDSELTYQWYQLDAKPAESATPTNGEAINGATSASYTAPTTEVGTKYYYCVVSVTDGAPATITSKAAAVTVTPVAVSGITLDKTSVSVKLDGTATLIATVTPDNATDKTVSWSSDNEAVAAVNSTTGEVTGKAVGTATITATIEGKTAKCEVVVYDDTKVETPETEDPAETGVAIDETVMEEAKEAIVASLPEKVKEAVASGENLTTTLAVEPVAAAAVREEVKNKVEEKLEELGDTAGVINSYLDIDLTVKAGNASGKITELATPITINIPVPQELQNKGLTFTIVNVHEGEPIVYTNRSVDPKVITIDVDKFSTFALVYSAAPAATDKYNVTVNGSSATATGAGKHAVGDTVTISAGDRGSKYRFNGWTSDGNVTFAKPSDETTTFRMPAKDVTITANWTYTGSHSGGASGGSNDSSSSTTTTTTTPVSNAPVNVTTTAAKAAAKEAAQAAKSSNATVAKVRLLNPGTISLEGLKAIATETGMTTKVYADTMNGSLVDVRIALDPASATKDVNLSASTTNAAAKARKAFFEKWFSNTVSVVSLGQQDSFGTRVELCAKVDPSLNTANLVFYSYERTTNTYHRLDNVNAWVDTNGYVHFTTEPAGDIIITDSPLTHK